jgi:hypothetical protein
VYGDVFLIEREGARPFQAERLALGETSGRNEAWLRDTLFENPKILPVEQVDPSYGPLIPLCKELRTAAGPVDIAFINRHGQLTLVECKLWRNPEARRKVVAQLLDYARAVSTWSYSDLQRQVAAATSLKGNVPFSKVSCEHDDVIEQRFIDSAYRALRNGRFLLLIAGDGIREDVGAIAELINRNAASGFSFGLIEVALYGLDDEGLAIQPRVVARTQLIKRTVVLLGEGQHAQLSEDGPGDGAHVEAENVQGAQSNVLGETPRQAEYRAWWTPVMGMAFDDPEQEPNKLYWPNHLRTPLQWTGTWITAYRYGKGRNARIGVGNGGRAGADVALVDRLTPHKAAILDSLPDSEYVFKSKGDDYCYTTTRDANDFADDDAQRNWIMETINQYVNVFRPLIDRVIREDEAATAR